MKPNRVNILEVAIDRMVFERRSSATGDEQLLDELRRHANRARRILSEVNPSVERDLFPDLDETAFA